MVMTRTASSSDSGTGASDTRAPSLIWSSTHCRKARSVPPPALLNLPACSARNR